MNLEFYRRVRLIFRAIVYIPILLSNLITNKKCKKKTTFTSNKNHVQMYGNKKIRDHIKTFNGKRDEEIYGDICERRKLTKRKSNSVLLRLIWVRFPIVEIVNTARKV